MILRDNIFPVLLGIACAIAIGNSGLAQDEANDSANSENSGETGTVNGFVLYEGDLPRSWRADQQAPTEVVLDAEGKPDPTRIKVPKPVTVATGGGVRKVVVWLESDEAKRRAKAISDQTFVIDQKKSVFEPAVLVIPKGATVHFENSDLINHNVNLNSRRQGKNFMLNSGKSRDVTFRLTDSIKIACDLHAWMRGSLVVIESPWHAVTDDEGNFSIPNVAPGKYLLHVDHTRLKPHADPPEIEVTGGESVRVEVPMGLGPR